MKSSISKESNQPMSMDEDQETKSITSNSQSQVNIIVFCFEILKSTNRKSLVEGHNKRAYIELISLL
jgi:hypothetical protein